MYKHKDIVITDGVSNGVKYITWGDLNKPTIVYLHGIGERGTNPFAIINQSPVKAGWDATISQRVGFVHEEFFQKGLSIIAPQLVSGTWTPEYIDKFLDGINIPNKILAGWSLGGGGVAKYMNQSVKKHKFKGACLIATGDYSQAGVNFNVPTKAIHSPSDTTTIKTQTTDKIWAGIPAHFKVSYDQPSGGGHWVETSFWNPSTGIYEWINSLFQDIQIPTPEGKLILENGKVYGVFDTQKIELVRL